MRDASYAELDLTPLSSVTHLHLSYCSPPIPPDLITFLSGGSNGGGRSSGKDGLTSSSSVPPLTHLRLSRLPANTFQLFESTVDLYAKAATSSAPTTVRHVPSRIWAAQTALYDLVMASTHMPALERVTLELNGLQALNEPEWASAAVAAGATQGVGFGTAASAPFVSQTQWAKQASIC